eukprot:8412943-Pyramimonas_sp.AAC.1
MTRASNDIGVRSPKRQSSAIRTHGIDHKTSEIEDVRHGWKVHSVEEMREPWTAPGPGSAPPLVATTTRDQPALSRRGQRRRRERWKNPGMKRGPEKSAKKR